MKCSPLTLWQRVSVIWSSPLSSFTLVFLLTPTMLQLVHSSAYFIWTVCTQGGVTCRTCEKAAVSPSCSNGVFHPSSVKVFELSHCHCFLVYFTGAFSGPLFWQWLWWWLVSDISCCWAGMLDWSGLGDFVYVLWMTGGWFNSCGSFSMAERSEILKICEILDAGLSLYLISIFLCPPPPWRPLFIVIYKGGIFFWQGLKVGISEDPWSVHIIAGWIMAC